MGKMRRFLADEMLAKLCRFMRMAGVPVRQVCGMSDGQILLLAKRGGYTLLTCDEDLCRRCLKRGVACLLLPPDGTGRQLSEVFSRFRLRPPRFSPSTLCPKCGGRLVRIAKGMLRGKVYPRVLERRRLFWRCSSCAKIYWSGSHYERVRRMFWRIRRSLQRR
jgi:uncharacterized protein with PIN domain